MADVNKLYKGVLFSEYTFRTAFDIASEFYRATWDDPEWREIMLKPDQSQEPPSASPIRSSFVDADGLRTTGGIEEFLTACGDGSVEEVTAGFDITGVDIHAFHVTYTCGVGTRIRIGSSKESTARAVNTPFVEAFASGDFVALPADKKGSSLIFLSHAHQDASIAVALQQVIETAFAGRISVFCSSDENRSIQLGDPLTQRIVEAVRRCSAALILISPDSVGRPWINIETGAAWVNEKVIIPCCVCGFGPGDLPSPLQQFKAATLRGTKADMVQLLDRLGLLVDAQLTWSDGDSRRTIAQFRQKVKQSATRDRADDVSGSGRLAIAQLEKALGDPARYNGEFIHGVPVRYGGYTPVDFRTAAPPQFWGAQYAQTGRAVVRLAHGSRELDAYCASGAALDRLDEDAEGSTLTVTLQVWTAKENNPVFQLSLG